MPCKISGMVAAMALGLIFLPSPGQSQSPQAGMAGLTRGQVAELNRMTFPVRMSVIYKRFGRGQYKTWAAVLYPTVEGDISLTYKNGWFTSRIKVNRNSCVNEAGNQCQK
jgi:hypothetical protein